MIVLFIYFLLSVDVEGSVIQPIYCITLSPNLMPLHGHGHIVIGHGHIYLFDFINCD